MKKSMLTKRILTAVLCGAFMAVGSGSVLAAEAPVSAAPAETIKADQLSNEWDKVFPESDKVNHKKVTFHNRYGITLVADLYTPKNMKKGEKLPAIAVCGPFGAVKEQVSGRYAQTMAERGFLTIAFDPSFTGESGGEPRNVGSPDINTEDYCAAVDFLATNDMVDPERIGIIGICGWGGMAINAAAQDTRIKATVTSTMYDMTRLAREGYGHSTDSPEQHRAQLKVMNDQRTADYRNGTYARVGFRATPNTVADNAPQFVKDYANFYSTPLGYHKRNVGSSGGWNVTSNLSFMNMPLLMRAAEIETPVLLIHGSKAHSRVFSEGAFEAMTGVHVEGENKIVGNKELYLIPDAVHTDLYYDRGGVIPYDKIEKFFRDNLK